MLRSLHDQKNSNIESKSDPEERKQHPINQFQRLPGEIQAQAATFLDSKSLSFLASASVSQNKFFKVNLNQRWEEMLLQKIAKLEDEVSSVEHELKKVNGAITRLKNGFMFSARPRNNTSNLPQLDYKLMRQTPRLRNAILQVVYESTERAKQHPLSEFLVKKIDSLTNRAKNIFPPFTKTEVSSHYKRNERGCF